MSFGNLGDRMKDYESVPRTRLTRRTPVLARLDGRAFHSLTRGMTKPYDGDFHACMWAAAMALCKDIDGCRLAYVQSDEITLLIVDYERLDSEAWFGHEVQKMCSVAASVCTGAFNAEFFSRFPRKRKVPAFDARFWNVPKEEVANAFLWRQNDATRNSLQMLCQSRFSSSQLHGKKSPDLHEMLHGIGLNWSHLPTAQKRGVCVVHVEEETPGAEGPVLRHRWKVDTEIPIFSSPEGRAYIERHVVFPDEPVGG